MDIIRSNDDTFAAILIQLLYGKCGLPIDPVVHHILRKNGHIEQECASTSQDIRYGFQQTFASAVRVGENAERIREITACGKQKQGDGETLHRPPPVVFEDLRNAA